MSKSMLAEASACCIGGAWFIVFAFVTNGAWWERTIVFGAGLSLVGAAWFIMQMSDWKLNLRNRLACVKMVKTRRNGNV